MQRLQIKPGVVVSGPIFPEPVRVLAVESLGAAIKLIGQGLNTNMVHQPILQPDQIASLTFTPEKEPFDGDAKRFRLGVEAWRLGLAKRDLNRSYVIGKSAEARERRLVPEVVEEFFTEAGPVVGVTPTVVKGQEHVYRVGRIPRTRWPVGGRLEGRFGRLGRDYKNVVFNKLESTEFSDYSLSS